MKLHLGPLDWVIVLAWGAGVGGLAGALFDPPTGIAVTISLSTSGSALYICRDYARHYVFRPLLDWLLRPHYWEREQ